MTALIAVKSNERRDALHALLESIAQFDVIKQASDRQSGPDQVKGRCPTLVLVDFGLFPTIHAHCQKTAMVLVENREERVQAHAAGAEQVFIEGTPVSQLVAAIEALLDTEDRDER